jgi:hypothetical protein
MVISRALYSFLSNRRKIMAASKSSDTVCEAVAVFPNEATLQAAIDELLSAGFDHGDVSLMASEDTVEEHLGHRYRKVTELEDRREAPHVAYVSPETRGDAEGAVIGTLMYVGAGVLMGPAAAAGGGLAALAAAAALGGGAGAAIGSILALYIDQKHADYIEEQVLRGGLVLWVRVCNGDAEKRALDILKRHSGKDVHVHRFAPR